MSQERWLKGYKVVVKNPYNNNRKHYYMSSYTDIFSTYGVKKITERPEKIIGRKHHIGGPLCVFSRLENAAKYAKLTCGRTRIIFECKYLKSEETRLWFPGQQIDSVECQTKGKVLADKVMLVKRVFKKDLKAKGLI